MRNLKRALSMAMASVMLMGMSVVGTSAVSVNDFSDVDSINNKEAVAIATGLGIFDGYDDGSFKPEKVVTRAEMAVVIAKILHGADVNPSNLTGAGKFTDVPAWAEGYVNLVAALGIIEGYGDGKFGPNDPVTTVQANIMLLKALGYYTAEGDNLSSNWADAQLAATSKAAALGITGDLELPMAAGLTREDVAELTFNALFAQRVAYDDVRGLHVKSNDRNVVVTNGTVDQYNTLAQNTFGLYKTEGVVVANSMTDMNLVGDSNVGNQTKVMFDEATDVNLDGRTDGTEYVFEYETGLDMIGHAAKVYYKIEKKAPVVYAITDNAVKAVWTYTDTNISAVASKAGFNRNTKNTTVVMNYALNDVEAYANHDDGQPMLLISNNNDLTVDYAIVLEQELDYVKKIAINEADPENPIGTATMDCWGSLSDDTDLIVADEIAEGDYVILTPVDNNNDGTADVVIAEKASTQTEMLTVVDRTYQTTDKLSSATETYKKSTVNIDDTMVANGVTNPTVGGNTGTETEKYGVTPYASVALAGEYTLVFDNFGKLIAIADPDAKSNVNIAYVAQFGQKINTDPSLNDAYRLTAHVYFADGTNGIYYVDNDNTKSFFDDVKVDQSGNLTKNGSAFTVATVAALNTLNNDSNSFGTYINLWDAKIDEDSKTIVLATLSDNGDETKVNTLKKNVTYLGTDTTPNPAEKIYANADTVFFFVDGQYETTADPLTVGVVTGISAIPTGLTVAADAKDTSVGTKNDATVGIAELIQKDVKDDQGNVKYVSAQGVLVVGEEITSTLDDVYFYNEKYTITRVAKDEYTLTYNLYNAATGEYAPFTYEKLFNTYDKAETEAEQYGAGYYKINTKKLSAVYSESASITGTTWTDVSTQNGQTAGDGIVDNTAIATYGGKQYVVATNFIEYETYGSIVTLYTGTNNDATAVDATKAKVVNLTKYENVDDLADLAALVSAHQKSHNDANTNTTVVAKLAYTYKDNAVDTIYVMSVTAPATKDFGSNGNNGNGVYSASLVKNNGNLDLTVNSTTALTADVDFSWVVYMTNTTNGLTFEAARSASDVTTFDTTDTTETVSNVVTSSNNNCVYYAVVTLANGTTITTSSIVG